MKTKHQTVGSAQFRLVVLTAIFAFARDSRDSSENFPFTFRLVFVDGCILKRKAETLAKFSLLLSYKNFIQIIIFNFFINSE